MDDNTVKAIVSMVCIAITVNVALYMGINGTVLAAGIGALAGLGGFAIAKLTGKTDTSKEKGL